ncbi:hypothetical protein DUNSADRAFT_967 [Dunaliella salina]|uniref:Uncharacterized protein n=1 Tax=Dunaliella salina TaxID=3046 RepID=A0ABQ7GXR3_DUNSA|nr:hypothetical protein DUNSADRAFT_967 [Dunaliella salina]|eukprot:KAF5839396.1 hypothetical protein DUNSADRAFT_967 [Dunaliella salina]
MFMQKQCLRSQIAARPAAVRASPVVCKASKGEQQSNSLQLAAASLCASACAASLLALPASAGVVLQQPELKKFNEPGKVAPAPAAPAAPAPAPEKEEKSSAEKKAEQEGGLEDPLDARVLALPAAILAIGGAGFAASKVDSGFSEWINESGALVRKSDNWGGFEEDIKETYPYVPDGVFPSKGGGGGAKKASPPKKGGGFPFGKK